MTNWSDIASQPAPPPEDPLEQIRLRLSSLETRCRRLTWLVVIGLIACCGSGWLGYRFGQSFGLSASSASLSVNDLAAGNVKARTLEVQEIIVSSPPPRSAQIFLGYKNAKGTLEFSSGGTPWARLQEDGNSAELKLMGWGADVVLSTQKPHYGLKLFTGKEVAFLGLEHGSRPNLYLGNGQRRVIDLQTGPDLIKFFLCNHNGTAGTVLFADHGTSVLAVRGPRCPENAGLILRSDQDAERFSIIDRQEKTRLRLQVDAAGSPEFEMFDAKGKPLSPTRGK